MTFTRRNVLAGGAALTAAAASPVHAQTRRQQQPAPRQQQPAQPQPQQANLYIRESIATHIKFKTPQLESFRRGVDAMMRLPSWDKRSWWFQAYLHGVVANQVPPEMQAFVGPYFNKSPTRNYFFLAWNRMHLYFFERILRAGSGDPAFSIPYWAFEDPAQSRVPAVFLPDADEVALGQAGVYARRNALARALRHSQIDRGLAGLRPEIARRFEAALRVGGFSTREQAAAGQSFGGMVVQNPQEGTGIGAAEAVANEVHDALGLFGGDLGSVLTAARDPLFWCIRANIDRLWTKWTNPALGRDPPTRDSYWMNTIFTFVDENGQDVRVAGWHIADPQFQLRYRYEDETARPAQFNFGEVIPPRTPPRPSTVLARIGEARFAGRDLRAVFPAVANLTMTDVRSSDFRVVVRDVTAPDRTSPYDVYLGAGTAAPIPVGTLALFGGGRAARPTAAGPISMTFDATAAIQQLARSAGAALTGLGVIVVRRGLADASGQELVSVDPDAPRVGAIELVRIVNS
jgi:hypothetical protein